MLFSIFFYYTLKLKTSANTHESKQQDSVDQEHETDFFWFKKIYLLKKLKKLNSCLGGAQAKKKKKNLSRFARRYLSVIPSSVYPERLFSEAGNLYEQKRNHLLPKAFFSSSHLEKQDQVYL